jgi:phosphatidylserine/phosphatidylglycerophosphate/cardiolipin synthase-like enzyme
VSGQHIQHVAPITLSSAPLLKRGLTCWRIERACRIAPIVHAAAYFRLVREALLHARHSVLFIGWEFDIRIKLDPWPKGLAPFLRDVMVGIARTEPEYHRQAGVREIEALHLAAIAAARRTIYIEGQYFAARCVGEALAMRLREVDGPEIVVVNSERARGWVEQKAMDAARGPLLGYLRGADRYGRFRIFPASDRERRAHLRSRQGARN